MTLDLGDILSLLVIDYVVLANGKVCDTGKQTDSDYASRGNECVFGSGCG